VTPVFLFMGLTNKTVVSSQEILPKMTKPPPAGVSIDSATGVLTVRR
jgi:hypothetical protein